MSKSKRLMELMMTVNTKRKFTVRELADEFGVSMRTILRDLQELGELGIPLYSEVGPHGGYQVLRERILPPIAFSEHEAVAMFFAYQSLQLYEALPFDAEMQSALKKFYHYLPGDVKGRIDAMKNRIVFWTKSYNRPAPFVKLILEAATSQQVVRMLYDGKDGVEEREVQPLGTYAHNGFWYCPAWCLKRGAWRVFRIDRVVGAEIVQGSPHAQDFSSMSILDWLQPKRLPGGKISVHATFTREGVRRSESEPWVRDAMEIRPDGGGELRGDYLRDEIEYMAQFFFFLGTDAHVHGGDELLELVRAKVRAMQELYL